jgi:competence protein ComEC
VVLGGRRSLAVAGALVAVGWWWGGLRLDGLERSALAERIGDTALARIEVTGPTRTGTFTMRSPVRVLRFDDAELREPSRLDLPPGRAPPQGAVLEAVVRVVAPRGKEDGFDEAAYLARHGAHVVLRAGSYRVVGARGGLGGLADSLRRRLAATMAPGLTGERRAVVAGVVLGEDEGLDAGLQDSFRAAGLYHLLAVSGQNIAYVVVGVLLLAWTLGLPRWAGEAAAILAVAGYVAAVGWQPSVVRAGVAGVLASLAWLAARPRDRWYFLLVGAAVLLAWSPLSLLDPGFQLSFAAVAAIFVLVPRLGRRLEGYPLPRRLAEAVAVSAACGVVTAPILWLHFGAVPVYSVVSNALAEPAVAPLLGLALMAAAVHPVLPAASAALAWLDGWLAAYLAWCARTVGGLPFAQVSSVTAVGMLAAAGAVIWVTLRLRAPRGPRLLALAATVLAFTCAWQLRPQARANAPPSGLRITFLDVGQGDSALLQAPGGAVLVDEGPPEAHVARQLHDLGVDRLDAVVLTHPQRDHVGGAADVLSRLTVSTIIDPAIPSSSADEAAARAEARARRVRLVVAREGEVFSLGKLRFRVLWPDSAGTLGADPNQYAVVLLASYGQVDALLTADAESDVTLPLDPPAVEILKVAHHGSDDSGLEELLERIRPRIAVVSVGRGNDYGHPTPETMGTLRAFPGLAVYRTDEDGRVVVESDGVHVTVRTER